MFLRSVASRVLHHLLDFIYSGQLKLSCRNVWDLTEACSQFQLQGALSLCLNFLQDNMDEISCLDVLALAEAFSLVDLGIRAEEYFLTNFQRVAEGEKFRDLPCDHLMRLLERDKLNAESEVRLDYKNKKTAFSMRFGHLSTCKAGHRNRTFINFISHF